MKRLPPCFEELHPAALMAIGFFGGMIVLLLILIAMSVWIPAE